jgi:hypothetical protein
LDGSENSSRHIWKELMLTEVILMALSHGIEIFQNLIEGFVVCSFEFSEGGWEPRVLFPALVLVLHIIKTTR